VGTPYLFLNINSVAKLRRRNIEIVLSFGAIGGA